jgi:hypothetical protein
MSSLEANILSIASKYSARQLSTHRETASTVNRWTVETLLL